MPPTAKAEPAGMHIMLNGAEPITVPTPTVECWRNTPMTEAKSSGALHPAAYHQTAITQTTGEHSHIPMKGLPYYHTSTTAPTVLRQQHLQGYHYARTECQAMGRGS